MTIHKTNRWHWQADWTGMVEFPIGRHLVRVPLEEIARMARELSPKSWADGVITSPSRTGASANAVSNMR
jgi:hypothetical protein